MEARLFPLYSHFIVVVRLWLRRLDLVLDTAPLDEGTSRIWPSSNSVRLGVENKLTSTFQGMDFVDMRIQIGSTHCSSLPKGNMVAVFPVVINSTG